MAIALTSSAGAGLVATSAEYVSSFGPAVIVATLILGLGYLYIQGPPHINLPGPEEDQGKLIKKHFEQHTFDHYLKHIRETYGTAARLKVAKRNIVVVSDADITQPVYHDTATFHRPSEVMSAIEWMCAPASALFGLEGDVWQRHRRSMIPAFSQKTVKLLLGLTHAKCERLMEQWNQATLPLTANIHVTFTKLTLDIIGLTLFGHDFKTIDSAEAEMRDAVASLMRGVNKRSFLPKFLWFLLPGKEADEAGRRVLRSKVDEILRVKATERTKDTSRTDMVDLLMQGGELSHDEMIGEMFGLLFAGHETSSNTLTIVLRNILQNTEVKRKVQEEVDASEIRTGAVPDARTVGNLRFIDCVIKETLRMSPVITSFGRRSLKSVTIKGINIPKGTMIMPDIIGHHINSQYFPSPAEFKPERWLNSEEWLKAGTYIPFGDGGHRCIGERLALAEMRLIIAMLFHRFDFEIPQDQETQVVYEGTAKIPDMQVIVKARTG